MPFSRLVEVGRVCMINFGKEYGQLVVIADVVDQAYALADNTVTGQRGKVLFKKSNKSLLALLERFTQLS